MSNNSTPWLDGLLNGFRRMLVGGNPVAIPPTQIANDLNIVKGASAVFNPNTGALDLSFAGGAVAYVNVTDAPYNAKGDGTTDDSAAIAAAATAAQGLGAGVYFPHGTYRISTTTALANAPSAIELGAQISVDSGKTLTFAGLVDGAPDQYIFPGSGTVILDGNAGVYAVWFGAGVKADLAAVINACDTALASNVGFIWVNVNGGNLLSYVVIHQGHHLRLWPGTYAPNFNHDTFNLNATPWLLDDYTSLRGAGDSTVLLENAGAASWGPGQAQIVIDAYQHVVDANINNLGGYGHLQISDVQIQAPPGNAFGIDGAVGAIQLGNVYGCVIERVTCHRNHGGGVYLGALSTPRIMSGWAVSCGAGPSGPTILTGTGTKFSSILFPGQVFVITDLRDAGIVLTGTAGSNVWTTPHDLTAGPVQLKASESIVIDLLQYVVSSVTYDSGSGLSTVTTVEQCNSTGQRYFDRGFFNIYSIRSDTNMQFQSAVTGYAGDYFGPALSNVSIAPLFCAYNNKIAKCTFRGCYGQVVGPVNAMGLDIESCDFLEPSPSLADALTYLDCEANSGYSYMARIRVRGCLFDGAGAFWDGITNGSASGIQIVGPTGASGQEPVYGGSAMQDDGHIISDNVFKNMIFGINALCVSNVVISGNMIKTVAANGAGIGLCNDVKITGNYFDDPVDAIGISGCQHVKVVGNTFRGRGNPQTVLAQDMTGITGDPYNPATTYPTDYVAVEGNIFEGPSPVITLVGAHSSADNVVNGVRCTSTNRGQAVAPRLVTTSATLNATDCAVFVDASGGDLTLTLPSAAVLPLAGTFPEYRIKRVDNSGHTVTVATTSAQTIDGAAPSPLAGRATLFIISDGTNWQNFPAAGGGGGATWGGLGALNVSIIPDTDNAYDLGSGADRMRAGYFAGFLAVGTSPALSGLLRLANNQSIVWRNFNDTADVTVFTFDNTHNLQIASPASIGVQAPNQVFISASGYGTTFLCGATAAVAGPLTGFSAPLRFGDSGGIDLGTGGTTTLSSAQYQNPIITVTSAGLTGGATLAFPTTSTYYVVDATGVSFGGYAVTVSAGTGAVTGSITTPGIYLVRVTGNNVYVK
jgi:hypothetical protein